LRTKIGVFFFYCDGGKLVKGYTKKIEPCDVLYAEMWGCIWGIYMAWREPFDHLIMENSKILINMISDNFKWEYLYFSSPYQEAAENELACANQPYLKWRK